MKTEFTKDEMIKGKSCYSMRQLMNLPFMNKEIITIEDVLTSEIPLKDKNWMVWNNCGLSLKEKKKLALQLAWMVLPIYEERYPDDSRVRECLEATELFINGLISIEELNIKRKNAAAAYDVATYAVDAYTYAAYDAAAYAAATYADAAYDDAAYDATTYAIKIKECLNYQEKYIQILISFCYGNN